MLFNPVELNLGDSETAKGVAVLGVSAAVADEQAVVVRLEDGGVAIATAFIVLDDVERSEGLAVGALTKDERRSAPSALLIDSSVIVGDGVINRVGDAVVFLHLQSAKTRPRCCGDCLRWEGVDASFEAA